MELFAVVHGPDKSPIPPMDCNSHPDQGCLVYASKEAAEASAVHQNALHGNDLEAIAVSLSEVYWPQR